MKHDPWYKSDLSYPAFSQTKLSLGVPHDVFSTFRIDEGTLLLLENLPKNQPKKILDMGCGYGALGLPIAAKFPDAQIEMVDRDLLAVAWTVKNAEHNLLSNVIAYGSLGYRDLRFHEKLYDWILCNVPARIGTPFITSLLEGGREKLTLSGEIRIVVIRDLAPLIINLGAERHWPIIEIARGPRHVVFSMTRNASSNLNANSCGYDEPENDELYLRDSIEMGGLKFDRPFDLGGDDPKRLASGLPVLLDALPRSTPPKRVFCFRSGYGILPLMSRARWPDAHVIAAERDLLATTYIRRNAKRLNFLGEKLEIRESAHFPDVIKPTERFNLIMGEISPSAGENVFQAEIQAIAKALEPGDQALLLALDKIEREWVRPFAVKNKFSLLPVISREGYVVLRLTQMRR